MSEEQTEQTEQAPAETQPWYSGYEFTEEQVGKLQNKGWDENPVKILDSYNHLEKLHGAGEDALAIVPENGDADAWGNLYNRLGRPENASDYVFQRGDGEPDTDESTNWLRDRLHEMGVSSAQATKFYNDVVQHDTELSKKESDDRNLSMDSELSKLRGEWGQKYDERVALANRALARFGVGEEVLEKMKGSAGYTDTIKAFANIGQEIGGDLLMPGAREAAFGQTRPMVMADKKKLMDEVMADNTRLTRYNSGRGEDYEKIKALREIANQMREG